MTLENIMEVAKAVSSGAISIPNSPQRSSDHFHDANYSSSSSSYSGSPHHISTSRDKFSTDGIPYVSKSASTKEDDVDTGDRPYKCPISSCNKRYKKLNGLISHHQTAHGHDPTLMPPEEPKPFKCTIPGCLKSYRNSNGLAYHLEKGHTDHAVTPDVAAATVINGSAATAALVAAAAAAAVAENSPDPTTRSSEITATPSRSASPSITKDSRKLHSSKTKKTTAAPTTTTTGITVATSTTAATTTTTATTTKPNSSSNNIPDDKSTIDKPYHCPHPGCNKSYKNPNGLAYHIERSKLSGHPSATTTTSSSSSSIAHSDSSPITPATTPPPIGNIGQFECTFDHCGQRFETSNKFFHHINTRHKEAPEEMRMNAMKSIEVSENAPVVTPSYGVFRCPLCPEVFEEADSLTNHLRDIHRGGDLLGHGS